LLGTLPVRAADAAFDQWVGAFTADWTRGSPSAASGAPDASDNSDLDAVLLSVQNTQREQRVALAQRGLAELAKFAPASLDATQRVSAELLRWHLDMFVARQPFADHAFVFRQLRGLHVALVDSIAERSALRRPRDVDNYLERLGKVAGQIELGIARARTAAGKGLIPPRFILERSLEQLEMFLEPPAAQNIFVTSLAGRGAGIEGLAPERLQQAVKRATQMVEEQVRPAYGRVRALLQELLPRSTDDAGISQRPDGAAAYAQALAGFTSTKLTAEEIHAIGLREVARLEREMDGLLRQLGFNEGSFAERFGRASFGTPLPETPDPRGVLIARYNEIIRDAEQRSTTLFNLKPKAPVEVRRVPALTERTASAHYTSPPADGSRGGVFWVPLPGSVFSLTPRMRSLAYHEAVPGHHFQLAIQQELKDLPRFRARRTFGGISAHSEGWGLYVEHLAVEEGWYDGDPAGRLGALGSELFRAKRLVVDTGLHTKRWTRQQAIDYGIAPSEVERYVVNPGQACSYMIGMLRIIELREEAKAALGARFSLPAFHDVILRTGTVPLDLLSSVVREWIVTQKSAPRS
jgi:uncharacterized protein (DUF885 family)